MNKKTFWPYGIVLALFSVVVACAVTIYICLDYPVYTDNSYFTSYQNVESDFTSIQESQARFEQSIKFDKNARLFSNGIESSESQNIRLRKQDINLKVAKLGEKISLEFDNNASATLQANLLLTRPETSKFDQTLEVNSQPKKLEVREFSVPKAGRWQVKIKLSESNESVAFYEFEFFVK